MIYSLDIVSIMKNLKIKLFADGADLNSILKLAKDEKIAGFTTNPTLMRKAGVQDYKAFAKEVLSHIKDKPISFEVFSDDFDEMERQAYKIASWGDNVYVKIPVMNTKGHPSYDLVNKLSHNNVKVNVTAVFTLEQVVNVALALKGGVPSICSQFAGRISDTGINPENIMRSTVAICDAIDNNIEVLWASPRSSIDMITANNVGCHIITMTADLIKKTVLFEKNLTEFSRETVLMFNEDSEKAGYIL